MRNRKAITAAALLMMLCGAAAHAQEDFQGEIEPLGSYTEIESTDDDQIEIQIYALQAGLFFQPVRPTYEYPLAEAAWVQRVGSVRVGGGATILTLDDTDLNEELELDGPLARLSTSFLHPDMPFLAELTGLFQDVEGATHLTGAFIDADVEQTVTISDYGLRAGWFVGPTIAVGGLVGQQTTEEEAALEGTIFGGAVDTVTTGETTRLRYGGWIKAVLQVNRRQTINAEASIKVIDWEETTESSTSSTVEEDGSNTEVALSFDYYPLRRLGVGALYEINTGDDEPEEGMRWGLRARVFPHPKVAVQAEFKQFVPENDEEGDPGAGEDEQEITGSVLVRF